MKSLAIAKWQLGYYKIAYKGIVRRLNQIQKNSLFKNQFF
ncbi:hypothetical protein HMPREF0378_0854 [Eubacterium nodatum ATCC 33099]|nr:hypothetical protein HMPREF0378_0854 [Eubacterium nodatum ATCC 33099]